MNDRIPDWMIFHDIMKGAEKEEELKKIYKKLKNFKYDDSSNVTLTTKEFETNKGGTSQDYVNYLYFKLKHLNPKAYWIGFKLEQKWETTETHTIIVIELSNFYWVIENAYKDYENIYQFNSLDDVFYFYYLAINNDKKDKKSFYDTIFEYTPSNKNINYIDFVENIRYNGEQNFLKRKKIDFSPFDISYYNIAINPPLVYEKEYKKSNIILKRLIQMQKSNIRDINEGTPWNMILDKKILKFNSNEVKIRYTPNLLERLTQFKNDQIAPRKLYGSSKNDIDISAPIIKNQIHMNQKLHPKLDLVVDFLLDEILMNIYLAHTSIKVGNENDERINRVVYAVLINKKGEGILLIVLNYSHKGKNPKMSPNKEDYLFIKEGIRQFLALPENNKWILDDFVEAEKRTLK